MFNYHNYFRKTIPKGILLIISAWYGELVREKEVLVNYWLPALFLKTKFKAAQMSVDGYICFMQWNTSQQ